MSAHIDKLVFILAISFQIAGSTRSMTSGSNHTISLIRYEQHYAARVYVMQQLTRCARYIYIPETLETFRFFRSPYDDFRSSQDQ